MSGSKFTANAHELRRKLAEEMAHDYPTPTSAIGLVNRLIELGDQIVMDLQSSSMEDRFRYRAMYLRLKQIAPERAKDITVYDFDEMSEEF